MPDATELVKAIKQAAVDAIEAAKPCNIVFGKVVSTSPLQINVEQKMILGKSQLVLSRNVTDFRTAISMTSADGWATENHTHKHEIKDTYTSGGTCEDNTHRHSINKKGLMITVHNGLAVGDQVILVRQQGGQKFIVLDRVVS